MQHFNFPFDPSKELIEEIDQSNQIHIHIRQRNSLNYITYVTGLPIESLKNLVRQFRINFHCSATILPSKDVPIIQLSGDQRDQILKLLIKKKYPKDNIIIHGF